MRALVLLLLGIGALVSVAGAAADRLEARVRLDAADQKRAVAMLLLKSDLGAGYAVERTSGLEPHLTCPALDESDLVVTGRAQSPYWARDYQIIGSTSAVYATRREAAAASKRRASRAGMTCLRDAFHDGFARQGEALNVTIRKLAFPRIGQSSTVHRLTFSGASGSPTFYVDSVLLTHGRARAGLMFAGVVIAPARSREIRLAKIVAGRMAKAMRGA